MEREPTVTIEHWRNVYSVAADHPDPDELRSRLDRMVESEVVDACRRRLAPLLDGSDRSIWLIREIQVDLAVDAGRNVAEQAGAAWGEQLAMEIGRVLEGGASGGSVVRFDDRAAYIVNWALDMAAGCAWDKWYYAEFQSLRSLPQGSAIAEGIVREADESKRILHLLRSRRGLDKVLGLLTNADAKRIYHGVLKANSDRHGDPRRWAARLLALWNGIAFDAEGGLWRDALRLYAAAQAEWPEAAENDASGLRCAVDGMLELRRVLAAFGSSELSAQFLQAVVAGQREAACEILQACGVSADADVIDFVSRAAGGDPSWAAFAVAVIGSSPSAGGWDASFASELGGVFLLGSAWCDLRIADALRAAAQSCEEPARAEAALRLLLAVRCMGSARSSLAIGDAAVQLFANVDGKMPLSELAAILASANAHAALQAVTGTMLERGDSEDDGWVAEHLDYFALSNVFEELRLDEDRELAWSRIGAAVLRNFARRLPRFAQSSPEYLFRNFLAGTSSVRTVEGRIEVRLSTSPLAVVLRIAGAYTTLSLPWREGVEICLLAPAE